jgi:hypothetical protein
MLQAKHGFLLPEVTLQTQPKLYTTKLSQCITRPRTARLEVYQI